MTTVTTRNAETVGRSPKMLAATALSTVLGMVLAVLNAVQERPDLLGGMPPVLQFLLLAMVPPLVIGFSTYRAAVGEVEVPVRDLGTVPLGGHEVEGR